MSDEFSDDLETPTEADLDSCYGSKYLGAVDIGDKKIRTRIGKVRKETMQQQGGKPERAKFVIYFTTIDKPMVLNATNKNALVDKLAGCRPTGLMPISAFTPRTRNSRANQPRVCACVC